MQALGKRQEKEKEEEEKRRPILAPSAASLQAAGNQEIKIFSKIYR